MNVKDWILDNPHKSTILILSVLIIQVVLGTHYPAVALPILYLIAITIVYCGILQIIRALKEW